VLTTPSVSCTPIPSEDEDVKRTSGETSALLGVRFVNPIASRTLRRTAPYCRPTAQ
jgi:hypothetical protein